MDGPLTPGAAAAIGQALAELDGVKPGVPFAALMKLAGGVEGRPLRLDLAAAEQIGAPVLVLRPAEAPDPVLERLSSRERQIARLVALGLSNKLIARELGISLATVKDHVHHALAKCGMRSRAELAAAVARARP